MSQEALLNVVPADAVPVETVPAASVPAPAERAPTPSEVIKSAPRAVRRSMPRAISFCVGLLLAVTAVLFLYRLTWLLLLLYLSFIAATILEAPVQWLKHGKIRRSLAAVLILGGGVALFCLAFYFLGNWIYGQANAVSTNLEHAPQRINDSVNHMKERFPGLGKRIGEFDVAAAVVNAAPSLSSLLAQAMSGFEILSGLVITFFIVLYMLVDGADHLRAIRGLLPKSSRMEVTNLYFKICRAHRGWALASLLNVTSAGVLASLGLYLLGIPGAFLLGFLAGLGEMIPNVGPLVAAMPAITLAFLATPEKFPYVIGMFMIVWIIQGYTISPLMMKFSIKLPVLVTLIAVLVFGTLFGFLGVLVAIPLVADLMVLWDFFSQRREVDVFDYDTVNAARAERGSPSNGAMAGSSHK